MVLCYYDCMIFAEQKIKDQWQYTCEDVFGVAVFTCSQQLDGDTLDAAITALLGVKSNAETISGSMPFNSTNIFYEFKKEPIWQDETEAEQAEYKQAPRTLTKLQAIKCWTKRVSWPITHVIKRLWKCVAVLPDVWKNSK